MMFVGGGMIAFTRLNIEAYPNPAPVILEITAQTPGLSAEEMERYYTIPIEVGLAGGPGEPHPDRGGVGAPPPPGREPRSLRGDFQNDRRGIGIGLDVQPGKCDQTAADEHHQDEQDDRAPGQSEREQPLDHRRPPSSPSCRRLSHVMAGSVVATKSPPLPPPPFGGGGGGGGH